MASPTPEQRDEQPPLQVIDGSVLEGGGQILRNAISLSGLCHRPVRIEKIRHGRQQPGLKNQHRTGLELVARITSAELTGATNGSSVVEFRPGKISLPGNWTADSVTAGATTLLLQIALPLLLFRSSSSTAPFQNSVLKLRGGTNGDHAPQSDYTQHIFLPSFQRHFLPASTTDENSPPKVTLELKKRGYHPKGGGEIVAKVWPLAPGEKLRSVTLMERSRLKAIHGIAHYAGLPRVIGEGMRDGATKWIKDKLTGYPTEGKVGEVEVNIVEKRERRELTTGAGSGIVLWAEFENGAVMGGGAVGRKGIEPTMVGRTAAEQLWRYIENDGVVDEWLQDQIIIFMALAEGISEVRCGKDEPTLHTRTAVWVAEQLTNAKFDVAQDRSGHWIICCQGIGFTMP